MNIVMRIKNDLRANIRSEVQSSNMHGICLASSTRENCYVSFKLTKKLRSGELPTKALRNISFSGFCDRFVPKEVFEN